MLLRVSLSLSLLLSLRRCRTLILLLLFASISKGKTHFQVSKSTQTKQSKGIEKFKDKLEMSRHPEVLWAQRSDKVYLTVALPDAKDINIKCEPQGLFTFSALGLQDQRFHFTLPLYGPIVPDGCKTKVGLRNILCSIQKEQKGWWKRLLKSEEKPAPYIKVDWNKWCDEDGEESSSDLAFDNDDDEDAYVGEDDESSDDEGMLYLPDLEKARGN